MENITHTYLWLLLVKFTFYLSRLFKQMSISPFYYFITGKLQLGILHFIPHVPDKFVKFNEFNKILKQNSIVEHFGYNEHPLTIRFFCCTQCITAVCREKLYKWGHAFLYVERHQSLPTLFSSIYLKTSEMNPSKWFTKDFLNQLYDCPKSHSLSLRMFNCSQTYLVFTGHLLS